MTDEEYCDAVISIHALRVEGDCRLIRTCSGRCVYFYPRPPGGGRHLYDLPKSLTVGDFYPRPPGGGRLSVTAILLILSDFYPRPPGGGRRRRFRVCIYLGRYFYPRPPGGGRPRGLGQTGKLRHFYPRPPGGGRPPCRRSRQTCSQCISIHALRVEGDDRRQENERYLSDFYPRPPGGGRRGYRLWR